MACSYSYDQDMRKTPLNPEMIRHRTKKEARLALIGSALIACFILVFCGGFFALFGSIYPWDSGTPVLIFGVLMHLALVAGMIMGIYLLVRALLCYRRATRGEITIDIDTVTYIEQDRPRTLLRRGHIQTIYEDFLHFKSGRELRVANGKYRDMDDEKFITVAYTATYNHILFIYRLSDYTWQE